MALTAEIFGFVVHYMAVRTFKLGSVMRGLMRVLRKMGGFLREFFCRPVAFRTSVDIGGLRILFVFLPMAGGTGQTMRQMFVRSEMTFRGRR